MDIAGIEIHVTIITNVERKVWNIYKNNTCK